MVEKKHYSLPFCNKVKSGNFKVYDYGFGNKGIAGVCIYRGNKSTPDNKGNDNKYLIIYIIWFLPYYFSKNKFLYYPLN